MIASAVAHITLYRDSSAVDLSALPGRLSQAGPPDQLLTQAQTVYFGDQTLLISSWTGGHRRFAEASGAIVRSAIVGSPRLRTPMATTVAKTSCIMGLPFHTLSCMFPLQMAYYVDL
jgi:hypothetical protein